MRKITVTEKKCSTCKSILPASEFYPHKRMKSGLQPSCRTCSRAWHRARPDYIRKKNAQFRSKYPTYNLDWCRKKAFGISRNDVLILLEAQDYKCIGCLRRFGDSLREHVDHCHSTGKIRGLLCRDCNVGIGTLGDDPARLIRLSKYISRHKTI